MLQLALGVVDAVPVDRRADMAEERLLYLASEHQFNRPVNYQDVLWEAAAEVILGVERLYCEGRLDMALCGMPSHNPGAEPVALLDRIASQIAIDIGRNNYTKLARTCVDALMAWAQSHPILDDDDDPQPTRLRWERRADQQWMGERATPGIWTTRQEALQEMG
jgi:hypothetical protein